VQVGASQYKQAGGMTQDLPGSEPATLFVVATPIGNLGDISTRALEVLATVAVVAAEDTRHTRALLSRFGISAALVSLHDHNERRQVPALITRLQQGQDIALVSDAGTPLISDPGYRLVSEARASGAVVKSVPGPSALTAALSVAGLPTDRFVFEGFLPPKTSSRRSRLSALALEPRTLVFFESPRRIMATLADLADTFGAGRRVAIARELTKHFETVVCGSIEQVASILLSDESQRRGELVLIVAGNDEPIASTAIDKEFLLEVLGEVLSPRSASRVAARLTGGGKNDYYRKLLARAGKDGDRSA